MPDALRFACLHRLLLAKKNPGFPHQLTINNQQNHGFSRYFIQMRTALSSSSQLPASS